MDEIVNLFMNSSVAIGVIVYFIFRDYKFTSSLNEKLTQLIDAMSTISQYLKDMEDERRRD